VESSRRGARAAVEHPPVTAEHLRRFDGSASPCMRVTWGGICRIQGDDRKI